MGREVVQDHVDRCTVRAGGADRLERGEGVRGALAPPDDAPELVVADGVAAVELPDPVQLVIVRGQPAGMACRRPTGTCLRPDHQGSELVEGEHSLREVAADVLDSGEFGVPVRVGGLLPRLGPLEGDLVWCRICRSRSRPIRIRRSASELRWSASLRTLAPAGERPPQLLGAGAGRLDDELFLVRTDLAGTATRPPRVQAGHPHLVESVDDLPNRVFIGLDEAGDRRHSVAASRGEHDHRQT
ncbi:hypothetical protein F4558_002855 [Micromonospora profundi]|nr:hypothetical protein [Micromonospora profundi]